MFFFIDGLNVVTVSTVAALVSRLVQIKRARARYLINDLFVMRKDNEILI
jgi:hypothetical protein